MALTTREARPGDGAAMGRLSRECFDTPLRDYLVSTQPGIGRFWEVVLDHPTSFPGREFRLAEDGSELIALAEFRVDGSSSLLSHVCVAEGARGQGVGTRLIREHLDRHPEVSKMDLDVFDHNVDAKRLYSRLGFVEQSVTEWLRGPLHEDRSSPARTLVLDDVHACVAWFETYGFCELSGTLDGAPFRAGRIGPDIMRLFAPEQLGDAALVAGLSRAFPGARELIAVLPAGKAPAESVLSTFVTATRMTAPDVQVTVPR